MARPFLAFLPLIAVAGCAHAPSGTVDARWKADADAPIDESTEEERWLGWEPDVYVNWQVTEELSLGARYGVFFPGSAFGDEDDARHALFLGVTYAF